MKGEGAAIVLIIGIGPANISSTPDIEKDF
jgi:hypothetical protein